MRSSGWWTLPSKRPRPAPAPRSSSANLACSKCIRNRRPKCSKPGRVVLSRIGLNVEDRVKPEIVSIQVITNVDPYQAQLLNRFRRGSILVPGETLLVLECAPAAYINYAFNEAEKGASIKLNHISSVGRFGRLWLSGTESEVVTAKNAAVKAIEELEGKPGK